MALQKKKTEAGTKAYQRTDTEDRSLVYRNFRRETVKKGSRRSTCYTSDLDQIEYVIVKDEIHPVAILELTRYDFDEYDGPPQRWAKYRSAVLERYFYRDAQGKFVQTMAKKIGVPAYIVLFRNDVKSFWLFDVCDPKALWIHKDEDEYKNWLQDLKTDFINKLKEVDNV